MKKGERNLKLLYYCTKKKLFQDLIERQQNKQEEIWQWQARGMRNALFWVNERKKINSISYGVHFKTTEESWEFVECLFLLKKVTQYSWVLVKGLKYLKHCGGNGAEAEILKGLFCASFDG